MAIGDHYIADTSHTTSFATAPLADGSLWTQMPRLTYRELTGRPQLKADGPAEVKTTIRYTFRDRDRMGHTNGDRVDSDRALAMTGNEERSVDQELRLISRPSQAKRWATEAVRFFGRPSMSGTLKVRHAILEARGITEGTLFMLDVQTTPGGTAKLRMMRCLKVTRQEEEATVECELEQNFIRAVTQAPQGAVVSIVSQQPPAVPHHRFFILPPLLNEGESYGVGALISRGSTVVQETAIAYDDDAGGDFPNIQTSRGFAAFGYLTEDSTRWGSGNAYGVPDEWVVGEAVVAGDLRFYAGQEWRVVTNHTTSTADRPDESAKWATVPLRFALYDDGEFYRFSSGISPADQRDNRLLLIVLNRDGDDILVTDGQPELEVFSVGDITAAGASDTGPTGDPAPKSNAIYLLTCLRARFGTTRFAFADETEAWLVFEADLPKLNHRDFRRLADLEADALFKLVPGTSSTFRDTDDGEITLPFIGANAFWPAVTWTTPADGATVGTTTAPDIEFSGGIADRDGNLVNVSITWRRSDGAETTALAVTMAASSSYDYNALISFPTDGSFHVVVRGQDAEGNIGQSVRTVIVDPTAGAGTIVATPVLSPFGGYHFSESYPVTVTATCATVGATIEMVVTDLSQTTVPVAGWTATATVDVGAGQRVWARATDGVLIDSSAAYVDFLVRP